MPRNYIPVRLNDFISGTASICDVYLKLDDNKYIKVLRKGDRFDPERLRRYEDNDVEVVYLRAQDFSEYLENSTRLASALSRKAGADQVMVARFVNRVADAVLGELLHGEFNEAGLLRARQITDDFVNNFDSTQNFRSLLESIEELGEEFSRHSLAVALVATGLSIQLKWKGQKTLQMLHLGGMLHDIGFRELPHELLTKPRAEMNREEVAAYETHPFRGAQILESIPSLAPEIVSLVYDHHEQGHGGGFPRGLKSTRIYPLARLITLADLYCHLALKSEMNPRPRRAKEAVDHLIRIHHADFEVSHWQALKSLVLPGEARKPA